MVGSAMPADGLIHWEPYLQWVHSLTEDGPVGYFPHRRETPESLHRLGQHPLVHVHQHTLPVEIRLRGLRSTQTVHALPSTVLSSLRLVLAPSGVRVKGHCVQEDWWTTSTGLAVRRDLSSSLEEERFIR